MSVASRNPFALLGDEDSPAVSVAAPVAKTEASAPKRNVPGAGVSNGARGGAAGSGASGRGGARGGARGGRAAAEAGAGGDDAPAKEDRGAARGASRGRGEGRGGRARGSGRGRGRAFDRHSMTGKEDTQKNIHQGWGGDDPKRELDAEDGARADAAEEGATPAGEAAAAAAPNGVVASSEGPEADAKLPAVEEEEKDNTKTLDEYLAELAAKRAQIGAKKETRAVDAGDLNALGQRVEKQADEDYFKTQKERTLRQREKKEKQVLEIQQSFNTPSAPRGTGRGGRGGERGLVGGDRGSGRGRGGDRGRGAFRGAPRGGSSIRGGGASSGGANLNLTDNSAFPTLG